MKHHIHWIKEGESNPHYVDAFDEATAITTAVAISKHIGLETIVQLDYPDRRCQQYYNGTVCYEAQRR